MRCARVCMVHGHVKMAVWMRVWTQELEAPAGQIELTAECTVTEGVELRSPPPGALTLGVPASAGTPARSYRLAAGTEEERAKWVSALRAAFGESPREPPPPALVSQLASLSGSVTAAGGSSLAVRLQKKLAMQAASDADLEVTLGRVPGMLLALRAAQAAYELVHGTDAAAELNRRCCILAAKAAVLIRRELVAGGLGVARGAVRHLLETAVAKDSRVRPANRRAVHLLPQAIAVDAADPFHVELAAAVRSVGNALSIALGAQLSEASVMALHDAFEALSSHQVLMALFGNALCPQDGIACEAALGDLLRGAGQFLEAAPAVSPAGSGES